MAQVRVGPQGLWRHVMRRGRSARRLFSSSGDAAGFVALLGELCGIRPIEIHAYCVMGSHYHLLVRAGLADLEEALAWLEGRLGRPLGARGPAGGSLRVLSVQAGRHLLLVSRYIHRNPVEAGLVARPAEWPHSSFPAYVNPAHAPGWLTTSAILGAFGTIGARARYRSFVNSSEVRNPLSQLWPGEP